jgi:hypothetical protein
MLRARNLLKNSSFRRHSFSSVGNTSTRKSSNYFFIIFPVVFNGTVLGAAYLREHRYLPETLAKELSILDPIQDLFKLGGLGYNAPETHTPEVLAPPPDSPSESVEEVKPEIVEELQPTEEQGPSDTNADSDTISVTESHESVDNTPIETEVISEIQTDETTQTAVEDVQEHQTQSIESPIIEPSVPVVVQQSPPHHPPSDPFLNVRVAALDDVLNEVAKQTAELKNDTEKALFRDLENLDEKALRYRIAQLSAEFFDRIKWEGVRQQQSLRDAEALFGQKYGQLINDLKLDFEKQLLEKERQLLIEHQQKSEELAAAHERKLIDALSTQAVQLTSSTKSEVEKSEIALRAQLQEEFTHQIALLRQEHVKKTLQAQESVTRQFVQVKDLNKLISNEFGKTTVSASVHALSAAVLLIETALLSGAPVDREIAALKKHAQGNPPYLTSTFIFD